MVCLDLPTYELDGYSEANVLFLVMKSTLELCGKDRNGVAKGFLKMSFEGDQGKPVLPTTFHF